MYAVSTADSLLSISDLLSLIVFFNPDTAAVRFVCTLSIAFCNSTSAALYAVSNCVIFSSSSASLLWKSVLNTASAALYAVSTAVSLLSISDLLSLIVLFNSDTAVFRFVCTLSIFVFKSVSAFDKSPLSSVTASLSAAFVSVIFSSSVEIAVLAEFSSAVRVASRAERLSSAVLSSFIAAASASL